MRTNNLNNIKPELIDKIISAAYGDASFIERMIVSWKASRNDKVRKVLEEYKATANSVHSIRKEKLPEYVIESVHRRIEFENESENLISKIYFALFTKPVFSAAVVSIFVLAIISMFLFRGESIAIVNKVFYKVEQKLDKEIINDRVSKQLNKGLNLVNEYLIGG